MLILSTVEIAVVRLHSSDRHNRHRSLERRSSSGEQTSVTPDSMSPTYSTGQSPLQTPTGSKRMTLITIQC